MLNQLTSNIQDPTHPLFPACYHSYCISRSASPKADEAIQQIMDFLQGLNPQQREAVAKTEGPLLILAGAGSGKTRVITHRVAHIVQDLGVPPSAVLAVTFTNKAAEEMRNRVTSLLDGVELSSAPNVFTFHSFCVRLLRRDGEALAQIRPGFKRNFIIYDQEDQVALIKSAYRHLDSTRSS